MGLRGEGVRHGWGVVVVGLVVGLPAVGGRPGYSRRETDRRGLVDLASRRGEVTIPGG